METEKRSGRISDIHLLTVKKQAPGEGLSGKIPEKTKRGVSDEAFGLSVAGCGTGKCGVMFHGGDAEGIL